MEQVIGGVARLKQLHVSDSAVVYSGHHGGPGIDVAVKVLANENPDFVNRVASEVQRVKGLSLDRGLVTLYESGVTETGRPYVISELCDGSIGSALQSGFRFEPDDACLLLASVARAVETLHAAGVTHQQIRPSNLLLNSGRCQLSDVGPIGAVTSGQTVSIRRSAGYVSPETFEEGIPGQPADVYSLGATLFHLVSGTIPFISNDDDPQLLSMLYRIATASVPDLRLKHVPDAVCLVIESAMRKMPTDRPSISELQTMLYAAAGQIGGDGASEWQASPKLIEAATVPAIVDSNERPDDDATDELDQVAITSETSKQQAVLDDPFLSVVEDSASVAISEPLAAVGSDAAGVSEPTESGSGSSRPTTGKFDGEKPPPPAAFVPPAPPEADLSSTTDSVSSVAPQTNDGASAIDDDQSSVVGALISPADRSLADASSAAGVVVDSDKTMVQASTGGALATPPPPTAAALVSVGNPPVDVGGSASQVVNDLRRALEEAVATVKIKSSQYVAERQAKRASAEQDRAPVAEQNLSFSSDQLSDDSAQPPVGSIYAASSPTTSAAIPADVNLAQSKGKEAQELATSVPAAAESPEPQPSVAELADDSPVIGSASLIQPLREQPSVEKIDVTSAHPAGSEAKSDSTRILPSADSASDPDKVSLVITSNRIPLLDNGLNLSSEPKPGVDGIRMLKPPSKQNTSHSDGGFARVVAKTKDGARIRTNDAVRKLQGQDGYYPPGSNERFSRNTLLLAGAAIVLFLAFSVVVAVSFGGSDNQALQAGDPANPSAVSSSSVDELTTSSESSGSAGVDSGNSSTSSSIASKAQDEPFVLSSQVDREQQLAVQSLNVKGIETEVVEEASEEFDAGKVIRTEPRAGIELAAGQVVTLYVSTGPPGTIVRNVTGQAQADAVATLQASGFQVEVVEESSESVEKGLVVRSVPAGGTRQPSGSRITLAVSSGPACSGSVVPEVVGLQLGRANEVLGAASLSAAAQQVVDGAAQPGTVTSANPAAGQCAEPGTAISLSVSCQSITVPAQENFNVADARNLGFEVDVRQVDRGDLQPGQLVSVEPAFGTVACPGSRLVVTINRQCDFVSIPDTVGRGVSRANRLIQRQSLRPVYVEEFNSNESRGDVIRTEPGAGAEVCQGSQVTVYVSLGDPPNDDD